MEVVTASPGGGGMSPFHNHDVREWSRLDSLTGVLERARLETDHWSANTATSSHKYGKVVDSRARNDAHGAVQQQAKRQLEVFESNVPGGHLQVIKTHTVSSSRWTSNSSTGSGGAVDGCQRNTTNSTATTTVTNGQDLGSDFEDLKLSLNPLDVTSQKSKASVGRSVGRRPPSRPRVREEAFSSFNTHTTSSINNPHATAAVNLHRVSRLCHQIHEHAVKQAFGERRHYFKSTKAVINKNEEFEKPPIHARESGDGVEIIEIESPNISDFETNHSKLTRTKSSSSEDLHLISYENDKSNKSVEDLEDLEQLQSWRRTSKIRRSLQFPKQNKPVSNKPPDLPENTGSVRRIREDLETGRRLNTALRGNNINLEALDQILQSISSSSSIQSDRSEKQETPEGESQTESKKDKRHSFVTVESLQEVKGRLRRTSCHTDDIYKETDCRNNNNMMTRKEEETDDGIGAEEYGIKGVANNNSSSSSNTSARVRSYVYGLETMLNKKPILGTGSLESRTSKQTNANSINRNDDWYNRRKSYGFEKVHNDSDTNKSVSLKNKGVIESSTDSGICKSNDTMNLPPLIKSNGFKSTDSSPDGHSDTNETPTIGKNINYTDYPPTSVIGNVKRFSSIFEQNKDTFQKRNDENTNSWNRNLVQKYRNDLEGTTVTIPIKSENYRRQLSAGSGTPSVTVNSSSDIKRHSIAVDEMKYVNNTFKVNDTADEITDEDNPNFNRKHKKVEFCKTEVHFAPDSGKINIIETDEKPPPTNTFRRRRRNSGSSYVEMIEECNKKGVPTLHFGDNYQKDVIRNQIQPHTQTENTVTVTTNGNIQEYFEINNEEKENSESDVPKGILKNKPIKPKPYILGDIDNSLQNTASPNSEIWGVRLKPVKKEDAPMWKSTVTLKNTTFDNNVQPKTKTMATRSPKTETNRNYNSAEFNENVEKIRIISSETEGNQKNESKGFSTKVNIGGSDSTFVQNAIVYNGFTNENHPSSWSKTEESNENIKTQTYNRSLVVRIGQNNDKTTSQQLFDKDCDNSNNKTTTKITIDLTPSPTTEKYYEHLKKLPTTSIQEFKSTSLILNTFKTEIFNRNDTVQRISDVKSSIPQQLEALKKLYEEALSDSEADKEVQLLMDQNGYESNKETDGECNSIVSGSWSKLRAYKLMNQEKNRSHLAIKSENALTGKDSRSHNSIGRIGCNQSNTRLPSKKDSEWEKHSSAPRNVQKQVPQSSNNYENKPFSTSKQSRTLTTSPDRNHSNMSPTVRGTEEHHYETLSKYRKSRSSSQERIYENDINKNNTRSQNRVDKNRDKLSRSPSPRAHTSVKTPPPIACVVRNLRKSDMKYFGLKESTPPPIPDKYFKKKNSQEVSQTNVNRRLIPAENTHEKLQQKKETSKYKLSSQTKSPQRHVQKTSPSQRKTDNAKRRSPVRKNSRPDSPIYENIDEVFDSSKNYSTDFDSSILEELTKAADQILQAVSDYADEESFSKLLSEEEADNRVKPEKLETISESKSWQQHSKTKGSHPKEIKPVKRASSTSSVESTHETRSASNTSKRITDSERYRKKSTESQAVRAATKARRLQRASSREALLLSHGSSSEDLPVKEETPPRKPRIVRKTKCTQLKITNGLDIQKRPTSSVKNYGNRISEDKAPVAALPEIRHKTAISTIRSTAEKMASKEKANKLKTDDRKKLSATSSRRDSIPGNINTNLSCDLKKDASELSSVKHLRNFFDSKFTTKE